MYAQFLKDERPWKWKQLQRDGTLDELLDSVAACTRDAYRTLTGAKSTPMQQAAAREIVIAEMVEEIEAIPELPPEEAARQAIPDICPELGDPVCFYDCPHLIYGRCSHPSRPGLPDGSGTIPGDDAPDGA